MMIGVPVYDNDDGGKTTCRPARRRPLAGTRIASTKAVVGAQGCVLVHSRHHARRRGDHQFETSEPACGSSQSKSSGVVHHAGTIVIATQPHNTATPRSALVACQFSDAGGAPS